jgi:acyl-CoA thioester hydrolase
MRRTRITVRVYYEDTDFSGVVYHANYLKFFERGRTEGMRAAGLNHAELLDAEEPTAYAVRNMSISFIKPARIDDLLEVVTEVTSMRGARLFFIQKIFKGEELLIEADVEVACMTLDGRPKRLDKSLIEWFENAELE